MPERSSASDTLKSPTLATFGVVVVSVIGGSVIAEPIAMARIGAIPGSIVLFVMGLMNYVAVTALAGAAARSSSVSTGRGRFTRLVQEHLGARGATAAGISSLLLWFGIVVVYLLGFGRTLAEVVAGDALWWSAGLGVVVVAVVAANARRLFVRAASSVAMVNVVLLVVLMVLALAQFKWHLFVHLPFRDSAPDPFVPDTIVKRLSGASADRIEHAVTAARLQIPTLAQITTSSSLRENLDLVFGTALFVYAGQTALFSVAPEVMRADPSGRSLVRGSQYALAAAIVMNAGWVLAALSAVPSAKFLEVRSLGVEVIGAALGGPTKWLAAIVVVLGFGVGAVNAAFALADVVTERLPSLHVSEVLLIPGVSVEVEEPSVGVRLVITAIDDHGRLALVARARSDSRSEWTYIAGDQWEANSLLSRFGKVPSHRWLRLTVLGESAAAVVVRVEGTMHIEHWPRADAVWWNDDLSLAELRMVQSLVRVPADESVLAARLGLDRSVVDPMVTRLLSEGAVTRGADGELRPVLGHRHRARSAVVA
ncbi:MAG: aromatic amino acid transport family protein, partial [Ilumatobacteraceae bacterium]